MRYLSLVGVLPAVDDCQLEKHCAAERHQEQDMFQPPKKMYIRLCARYVSNIFGVLHRRQIAATADTKQVFVCKKRAV